MKILFLILSLVCCFQPTSRAQTSLRFDHYGVEQGLSQSVVYCLFQDKKGFLWIGTHDGLNRYDGYEFKKYYCNPADSNSLAENSIYNIYEDEDGLLWIKTTHYLHCFQPATNTFTRFKIPGKINAMHRAAGQLPKKTEDLVPVDNFSEAWLFHKRERYFIPVLYPNGSGYVSANSQHSNIQRYQDQIMMAQKDQKGIVYFDLLNNMLKPARLKTPALFSNDTILLLKAQGNKIYAINKAGELLVAADGRLFRKKILPDSAGQVHFLAIAPGTNGFTWIATNNALYRYSEESQRFTKVILQFSNNQQSSIAENKSMLIDRLGNCWVGTFGEGLRKFVSDQKRIRNFSFGNGDGYLPGKFVHSIMEGADEQLYISFYDTQQLGIINAGRDGIHLLHNKKLPSDPYTIHNIFGKLVPVFGEHPLFYTSINNKKALIQGNPIFFRDRYHNKWIKHDYFLHNISHEKIISTGAFIEGVCEDREGNIWIATSGKGLGWLKLNGDQLHFFEVNASPFSISSNTINTLLYDSILHCLWLGTHNGFNQFMIANQQFIHYTTGNGLSHNNVYNMVMDKDGLLWLGTGNGISRFDTAKKSFRNFNRSDGLLNIEYNRYSAIKTRRGELVFGGTEGIDLFDPHQMNQRNPPPVVEITSLEVFNKSIPPGNKVSLSHKQNNLNISFAAMDFTNPATTKYAYRLKGIDQDWIYTEGKHTVSYASLSPGKYTFMVKAANDEDSWNEKPTTLLFTIAPPWWNTGWFYLLSFLVIAIALYLTFLYRLRKKLEVLQLRNRIHRDLHDDVGATLSAVKVYSEMLKEKPGQQQYLQLINENANEMLDKLEVITWASNPRHDTLESLVEKMKLQVTTLFYHNGIELDITKSDGLGDIELPGLIRQNLFLIFKEASNNIIKYAGATSCFVHFAKGNAKLSMTITDNGNGFDTTASTIGNGLMNMRSRVAEMGGFCEVISTGGKGTVIKVVLPIPFKIYTA